MGVIRDGFNQQDFKKGGAIMFQEDVQKRNDTTFNFINKAPGVVGQGKSAEPFKPAVKPQAVQVEKGGDNIRPKNSLGGAMNISFKTTTKKPKNVKLKL